jgi:hypothetical protein
MAASGIRAITFNIGVLESQRAWHSGDAALLQPDGCRLDLTGLLWLKLTNHGRVNQSQSVG